MAQLRCSFAAHMAIFGHNDMDLNKFFQFLTPKDRKFFPLFEQNGQQVAQASQTLVKVLYADDLDARRILIKDLLKQEDKADQLTESLLSLLHNSFITPFDREDVYALINSLNRIMHFVARSAKRIEMYDVKEISPEVQQLGKLVEQSAQELLKMLAEMNGKKHPKKILNARNAIAKLERKSDEVYGQAIKALFQDASNGVELIKNKEVLSAMENTLDKIDGAARILESVLIKSA